MGVHPDARGPRARDLGARVGPLRAAPLLGQHGRDDQGGAARRGLPLASPPSASHPLNKHSQVWNPAGSCTGTLLPPAAAAAPVARPGGFLSAVHGAAAPAAAAASDGPSHGSVITGLAEMALGGGTFLISAAIDGSIKVRRRRGAAARAAGAVP